MNRRQRCAGDQRPLAAGHGCPPCGHRRGHPGFRHQHAGRGAQAGPERHAPWRPRRHPQPGPAGGARLRRARGALGASRELGLPARALLLAARSRGHGPGAGGPGPAGRAHRPACRAAAHRRRGRNLPRGARCAATAAVPVLRPAGWPASPGGRQVLALPALQRAGRALPARGAARLAGPGARVRGRRGVPADRQAHHSVDAQPRTAQHVSYRRRRAAGSRLSGVRRGGRRPDAAGVRSRRQRA